MIEREPKKMEYDLVALGETWWRWRRRRANQFGVRKGGWSITRAPRAIRASVWLALDSCVAWVSHLDDVPAGERVLDALGAEQVDTRWVRRDGARPTGLVIKDPEWGVRYYRIESAPASWDRSTRRSH